MRDRRFPAVSRSLRRRDGVTGEFRPRVDYRFFHLSPREKRRPHCRPLSQKSDFDGKLATLGYTPPIESIRGLRRLRKWAN